MRHSRNWEGTSAILPTLRVFLQHVPPGLHLALQLVRLRSDLALDRVGKIACGTLAIGKVRQRFCPPYASFFSTYLPVFTSRSNWSVSRRIAQAWTMVRCGTLSKNLRTSAKCRGTLSLAAISAASASGPMLRSGRGASFPTGESANG